jgi:hypothetical protein
MYVNNDGWAKVMTLRSDGSPQAFLEGIALAVQRVGLPVAERDYENLTLRFESKGMTAWSWSGDETYVVVRPDGSGSAATFTSKGKPSGPFRMQARVSTAKWIERLIPGFGELWTDTKSRWSR